MEIVKLFPVKRGGGGERGAEVGWQSRLVSRNFYVSCFTHQPEIDPGSTHVDNNLKLYFLY